jgi:hypothetical protein
MLLLALAATGCEELISEHEVPEEVSPYPAVATPLAELSGVSFRIRVEFGKVRSPNVRRIQIAIRHARVGPATDRNSYCPRFTESFTATVAGQPMRIGGGFWSQVSTPAPTHWECFSLSASIELPAEVTPTEATITLRDDSMTRTISLGDLLVPRQLVPIGETSWVFAPGQKISLGWSPATDLTSLPKTLAYLTEPPSEEPLAIDVPVERTAGGIDLTLPTTPGAKTLFVQLSGTTLPCGEACTMDVLETARHAITIQ